MTETDSRIGPYRIVRRLGQGGMGAVYEAIHETIERRVAIKVLRPQLSVTADIAVRFINEARAVNLVNHPCIVQVSDYGQTADGTAYIVMELLEGETLTKRLQRSGGKLQVTDALRLCRQILSALQAAHSKNIVHRDLKPDNVMLVAEADPEAGTRERVKLLDFGIAKVSSAPQGISKADTQMDAVLGSPEYMSPEQCRGDRAIDAKADLYSLGVMLFRMLAGRLPFQAEGIGSLMGMHIYEQPPELSPLAPEVPADLAQLVKRMLTKAPAARPTALEAQQAVEQLFTRLGGRATSISMTALRGDIATESSPDGARMGTLASANGQAAAAARRSRVVPIAVVATTLCLLGGGAAVALLRGKKDVPAVEKPAADEPARPPKDKEPGPPQIVTPPDPGKKATASWSIESEPQGAQVVRVSDGKLLGTTPWKGTQPEGDEPVAVRLRLAGYLDKVLTLKPGSDASYSQVLRPQPGKKVRPPVGKVGPKNKQDGKKNEPEIAD